MVLREVYIDGACRHNGHPNAVGAAAAVFRNRRGVSDTKVAVLPDHPRPTNQRAELRAIILALEEALDKYDSLFSSPVLNLNIYSDSRYAVRCMDEWIRKWSRNGWRNSSGGEVVNRDLMEEAYDLEDRVRGVGTVMYQWIPRSENEEADAAVNNILDEAEGSL